MKKTILCYLFLSFSLSLMAQKRIMVISGGGAKGAWGGGIAQALYEKKGYEYKTVLGTSTGSLLAPFITINAYDDLRTGYTSVTDNDIFTVKPFKTKGKKRGQIRPLNAIFRIITGQRSLGSTMKLRKTIKQFFTEQHFEQIINSPDSLEFIPTVVNMNRSITEFKSSKEYDYEDMVNWMWASSNQPVFMTLYRRKEKGRSHPEYYVDGGLKDYVPIDEAINLARKYQIDSIDVIIHGRDYPEEDPLKRMKVIKALTRTISIFNNDVKENDITKATLLHRFGALYKQIKENCEGTGRTPEGQKVINIYFMPDATAKVVSNALLFDKQEMTTLWKQGYDFVDSELEKAYKLQLQVDIGATATIKINGIKIEAAEL